MEIEVGSKEWLEVRRTKITATDMCVILGVSKFKTPRQLYTEKISGCETARNPAMQRGLDMEPAARRCYEELSGNFVRAKFVISDECEWAAASLDGINCDGFAVEIKCPGREDHEKAIRGEIPRHYYPQLQWQMFVAKLQKIDYFSYRPNDVDPAIIINVDRSNSFIDEMIVKALEFRECILNKIPPAEAAKDVRKIEDPQFLEDEKTLNKLLTLSKKVEDEIECVREKLIAKCDGHASVGKLLKFMPSISKGRVDYDSIPELKDVNIEQYRKLGHMTWRVSVI